MVPTRNRILLGCHLVLEAKVGTQACSPVKSLAGTRLQVFEQLRSRDFGSPTFSLVLGSSRFIFTSHAFLQGSFWGESRRNEYADILVCWSTDLSCIQVRGWSKENRPFLQIASSESRSDALASTKSVCVLPSNVDLWPTLVRVKVTFLRVVNVLICFDLSYSEF